MARTALAAYLTFAVLHLMIHIRLLRHLTQAEGAALLAGLSAMIMIALALLFLTARLEP
ncbi:hypothetical protein [Nonomuraea helvata]|uniref:Uncharacterized protein n=1 Tax=Nonomuraea helvata TaxID=37484 RepID=A0ABV5S740_9ACTN